MLRKRIIQPFEFRFSKLGAQLFDCISNHLITLILQVRQLTRRWRIPRYFACPHLRVPGDNDLVRLSVQVVGLTDAVFCNLIEHAAFGIRQIRTAMKYRAIVRTRPARLITLVLRV